MRPRLRRKIYLAITLWAAFFLILCRAAPTEAASLRLAWDPSNDPAVAGSRIHSGEQPGHYTKRVQVEGRSTSSAFIDNLEEGKEYFLVVTSYSANGKESAYSSEISTISGGQGTSPTASPNTSRRVQRGGSDRARSQYKIPPSRKVSKTPEGKILYSNPPPGPPRPKSPVQRGAGAAAQ